MLRGPSAGPDEEAAAHQATSLPCRPAQQAGQSSAIDFSHTISNHIGNNSDMACTAHAGSEFDLWCTDAVKSDDSHGRTDTDTITTEIHASEQSLQKDNLLISTHSGQSAPPAEHQPSAAKDTLRPCVRIKTDEYFRQFLESELAQKWVEQELALLLEAPKSNDSSTSDSSKENTTQGAVSNTENPPLNDIHPSSSLPIPSSIPSEQSKIVQDFSSNSAHGEKPMHSLLVLKPIKILPDIIRANHQDFLERIKPVFIDSESNLSMGIFENQFEPLFNELALPAFLCSAFWRYLTEDWIPMPHLRHKDEDSSQSSIFMTVKTKEYRYIRLKRLSFERFSIKWTQLVEKYFDDEEAMVFEILRGTYPNQKNLSGESFEPVVQDVVQKHPELAFLQGNDLFQKRYVETVITRIFYSIAKGLPSLDVDVALNKTKGISVMDFKKNRLLRTIKDLPHMEINEEYKFFSYQHFFVIYCKFYDLDSGNKFRLTPADLKQYDENALSLVVCDRILQGSGYNREWRAVKNGKYSLTPYSFGASSLRKASSDSGVDLGADLNNDGDSTNNAASRELGTLTYLEFIWLIIAEEDKSSPTAIEYWFRILDLDDDGYLSLYELEQLWDHLDEYLSQDGASAFDIRDILCIALDLIKSPGRPQKMLDDSSRRMILTSDVKADDSDVIIRLADLKRSPPLAARFFDYFVNWRKVVERENSNGNRLYREIDELQQQYFQQLQFMPSPDSINADKNEEKESESTLNRSFSPANIPSDKRSSWSRWADVEYSNYIEQEVQERQRQEELLRRQKLASERAVKKANSKHVASRRKESSLLCENLEYLGESSSSPLTSRKKQGSPSSSSSSNYSSSSISEDIHDEDTEMRTCTANALGRMRRRKRWTRKPVFRKPKREDSLSAVPEDEYYSGDDTESSDDDNIYDIEVDSTSEEEEGDEQTGKYGNISSAVRKPEVDVDSTSIKNIAVEIEDVRIEMENLLRVRKVTSKSPVESDSDDDDGGAVDSSADIPVLNPKEAQLHCDASVYCETTVKSTARTARTSEYHHILGTAGQEHPAFRARLQHSPPRSPPMDFIRSSRAISAEINIPSTVDPFNSDDDDDDDEEDLD